MPVSSTFPGSSGGFPPKRFRPHRRSPATQAFTDHTTPRETSARLRVTGVRPWVLHYAAAVVVVALVTLFREPFAPLIGNSAPFTLYFPAIAIAGWLGGFGPGFVATLLSGYCARTWFFPPLGAFAIPDWPSAFRLGLFLFGGTLVSYLCGRLHQRTAELEKEKQLLEAKVKERTIHLERALGDMEAFSYTASHDLRAPLRTVRGYADALVEKHGGALDDESQHFLKRIQHSTDRLENMITDLLAFAKVSGATVQTQPIELKAAVAHVLEGPGRWHSPDVTVTYDRCVHRVQAHDILLRQVLQNLLENATKFVAPGVKPHIKLWSEPRGEMIRLWVEDNGIGIPPGDRQRLFGLFERGDTSKYAGTGVGLAIVDRAVAKMNGRVGVDSEVGKGSRFWVELWPG